MDDEALQLKTQQVDVDKLKVVKQKVEEAIQKTETAQKKLADSTKHLR